MDALLGFVLGPAVVPPATGELATWWAATAAQRAAWAAPIDRALAGGACADRLGFAFAVGYAEALRALVPTLPADSLGALCVTEEGGLHPRAILTRLVATGPGRYELSGRKKWATVGGPAPSLLVIASAGDDGKRNQLRAVRVRIDAPGLRLVPIATPFIPEVSHAEVELDRVAVTDDDLLPGDGYDGYVKRFRTIEDIHIRAAVTGYLIGVARRRGLPRELQERLLALALANRGLAHADPSAAATHVALAGLLALGAQLLAELEPLWSAVPDDEWTRWQRDRRLLRIAGGPRAARRDRAWSSLDAEA